MPPNRKSNFVGKGMIMATDGSTARNRKNTIIDEIIASATSPAPVIDANGHDPAGT